jgi:hypothetical protein
MTLSLNDIREIERFHRALYNYFHQARTALDGTNNDPEIVILANRAAHLADAWNCISHFKTDIYNLSRNPAGSYRDETIPKMLAELVFTELLDRQL